MCQVIVGRVEIGPVLHFPEHGKMDRHHERTEGKVKMAVRIGGVVVQKLGFIGLGVMGEAMCLNLATRSGMPVLGYDLRPEPLQRLVQAGIVACSSIAQMTGECELVFICLASDKQVEAACFGSDGITQQHSHTKVIVDCGTTSVAFTREASARCREKGITWIDAPIARGREGARAGTLAFMVGAQRDVFDAVTPILSTMGTDIIFCGDAGHGQIVKILNNKVVLQQVHALAEALAIAESLGVDGEVLFAAFAKGSADCRALHAQGMNHLLTGKFPPQTFSTLYALKDIGHAIHLAVEARVDASLARSTRDLLERSRDAGHGDDYYPVFVESLYQQK
jgi:3-hydroxyisobutyrate dehydrogenase-like beta-hydroxyacid dehydrogenase